MTFYHYYYDPAITIIIITSIVLFWLLYHYLSYNIIVAIIIGGVTDVIGGVTDVLQHSVGPVSGKWFTGCSSSLLLATKCWMECCHTLFLHAVRFWILLVLFFCLPSSFLFFVINFNIYFFFSWCPDQQSAQTSNFPALHPAMYTAVSP